MNNSTNDNNYERQILIASSALVFIEAIIGAFGNILVFIAIVVHEQLHSSFHFLIASMSVSDFFFIAVFLPAHAVSTLLQAPYFGNENTCAVVTLFHWSFAWVAGFHLVSISINRSLAIVAPRIYPKIYSNKGLVMNILLCYALGFSVNAWVIWPEGALYYEAISSCLPNAFQQKYIIACNVNQPMVIGLILISGLVLFIRVQMSKNKVNNLTGEQQDLRFDKHDMRVIKMISMPVVINMFTGGFYFAVLNYGAFSSPMLRLFADLLGSFCYCLNTLSYAVFNNQYKQAFVNVLGNKPKQLTVS